MAQLVDESTGSPFQRGVASDSFIGLWERLLIGDAVASQAIFNRYAHRLIELARRRMDDRLRQRVDPEDVVQSVLESFFRRQADGRIKALGWSSLWKCLAVMTIRKLGHRLEFHTAACRDLRVDTISPPQTPEGLVTWEVIANDPTPEQAAIFSELLDRALGSVRPQHQAIVRMALEGYTHPEIASRLDLSRRTIERVLRSIRDQWERLDPSDDSSSRS